MIVEGAKKTFSSKLCYPNGILKIELGPLQYAASIILAQSGRLDVAYNKSELVFKIGVYKFHLQTYVGEYSLKHSKKGIYQNRYVR